MFDIIVMLYYYSGVAEIGSSAIFLSFANPYVSLIPVRMSKNAPVPRSAPINGERRYIHTCSIDSSSSF